MPYTVRLTREAGNSLSDIEFELCDDFSSVVNIRVNGTDNEKIECFIELSDLASAIKSLEQRQEAFTPKSQ